MDAVSELVSTILSQNTNDVNRDRAFQQLRERFPTWEAVRDAPIKEVKEAIRVAGLANHKGPAILGALAHITAQRGGLSLDWLRDLPVDEAKAWQELGASYLSIENRQAGLKTASDHIEAMRKFKDATGLKF